AWGLSTLSVPLIGAMAVTVAVPPGSTAVPGPTMASANTRSGTADSAITLPHTGEEMVSVIAKRPAFLSDASCGRLSGPPGGQLPVRGVDGRFCLVEASLEHQCEEGVDDEELADP